MKKIFLFSLLSFILGMNSAFAQDVLVANLSHNGTVTNFYGIDALKNAHEAAEHGDTITLSVGNFNTYQFGITKAVTIYGAGMNLNADGQGTSFSDDLRIEITDEVNTPFHMEGIYTTKRWYINKAPKNSIISKCQMNGIRYNDEITCMHCRILSNLEGDAQKILYNCFLSQNTSNVSNILMYNCIMTITYGDRVSNGCIYNCIICPYANSPFSSTNTMYNNVTIGGPNDIYRDITAGGSNSLSTYAEIFKTFTGEYSDTETFELTDAAKTTYLGIDGTQVGLYGSVTPYDTTPTIPLITSYQVAAKAANGKVSVNVEINGGED